MERVPYDLLRNPTYIGMTKVPEFGEEAEHYVPGSHEAIVDENLSSGASSPKKDRRKKQHSNS